MNTKNSPVSTVTLMCHAPIVIPSIAEDRAADCEATTRGMREAARHLVDRQPGTLVVISPHTPRLTSAFGLLGVGPMAGDFAHFGIDTINVAVNGAPEAHARLLAAAATANVPCSRLPQYPLDHGATVPLWFLNEAGWSGPTLVVSLPAHGSHEMNTRFGDAIAAAARASVEAGERPWAVLASGDMSHRLKPGAPAGFHPRATEFDRFVVDCVRNGSYRDAVTPADELRDLAAEDVIDSLEVGMASVDFSTRGARFLSYEGPFGVGYMEAVVYDL